MTRWDHLIQAAFALDEKVAAGTMTAQALELWLASVGEVFDAAVDPVEDVEGWAVRRFAASLRAAVSAVQPTGS